MTAIDGQQIHITGVVQGVGFRPFVFGQAQRCRLTGWVRNTSAGVDIVVNGPSPALADFADALQRELPPLARIDQFESQSILPDGYTDFRILESRQEAGAFQPISPDVCVCDDCLRELFDPADRRYRYPFINCTNCGPRFTIIQDIPYDRPNTTMGSFPMCPECAAEYSNPLDRRFHAQPVACPSCGPQVWLVQPGASGIGRRNDQAIQEARTMLRAGRILAVKGLGGFHLACDAANEAAVTELRRRKGRSEKPFAVMMPNLKTVSFYCILSEAERQLLTSRERPIVILQRRDEHLLPGIAPGQQTLGVMLPYTPLHALLVEPESGFPEVLVMTSGNYSEEPIAHTNEQAHSDLSTLADAFLLHDRDIHIRCDDGIVQDVQVGTKKMTMFLRRSRGYAPLPVALPGTMPPLLGAGAELKNAFCLTKGSYAFLSHHIGDMENFEALRSFEEGIAHFERLFRVSPAAIACDMHPDYLATQYAHVRAKKDGIGAVRVQHHHAHIAACMLEHGMSGEQPVIGVAFDGTGYGDDGQVWGGEFLVADYGGYERPFHLRYAPLPGGDRAVKEVWRMALAWLQQADFAWEPDLPPVQLASPAAVSVVARMLDPANRNLLNTPLTSSMGRLFDAAAALAGVRQVATYEAQAAMEFEALCDPDETGSYPFALDDGAAVPGASVPGADVPGAIDPAPLFAALVADLRAGISRPKIAARFHNGVARMVVDVCREIGNSTGLRQVVLSGGVWQNRALLMRALPALQKAGFDVYTHRLVPPNDGGVALGQVAVAAWTLAPGWTTKKGQ